MFVVGFFWFLLLFGPWGRGGGIGSGSLVCLFFCIISKGVFVFSWIDLVSIGSHWIPKDFLDFLKDLYDFLRISLISLRIALISAGFHDFIKNFIDSLNDLLDF